MVFLVHVRCELGWAPQSTRQFLSAAKHFYRGMLGRDYASLNLIRARERRKLPTVLTAEEIRAILTNVPLLRYRIPLLLIYASGLRVRECIGLQVDHP